MKVSCHALAGLPQGKSLQYPLDRRLCGPQGQSGHSVEEKNSHLPPGIELRSSKILEKKWEYNGTIHQSFIGFEKVYDSVRKEVWYNILIEFGMPMELVKLIKMCSY
jgi:hypothetical protein